VLVENRIKVIKQLRAEQRGPVAVLSRINERIPIGINLDSITQRGNLMTISGSTSTEGLISSFSKDLEFSGGLFTGIDVQTEQVPATPTTEQLTKFTIRCNYNPPQAAQNPDAAQTASN
jgi:type IV pilus assembly protein PilN